MRSRQHSSSDNSNTYIPHPAPARTAAKTQSAMGATGSLIATIILPAIISLLFYLLLSYVIVPLWQRYQGRYSRYIPLDTISSHTTSLRRRIQEALARFLLPSSWRSDFQSGRFTIAGSNDSDNGFDEEDGEELFEVDENRREALSLDARRGHDAGLRLSRDLEEGFRDDSDDETETNIARVETQLR